MKKITIASVRKPLNLLLSYEISISRFVEMLNDEIGFERDIQIENKETNQNIIYVENTALNIFLLDKFGFIKYHTINYTIEKDIIRIDLENKNYKLTKDNTKNTITSDSLFNIISK